MHTRTAKNCKDAKIWNDDSLGRLRCNLNWRGLFTLKTKIYSLKTVNPSRSKK